MAIFASRRSILKRAAVGIAAAASSCLRFVHASDVGKVRVGAIRWDAWYGPDTAPGSSEWYAAHDLDPRQYHRRAPFFAREISKTQMLINGTQDSMDAEISYAADAGINYWAFGWYQNGRPLHKAWEYYQSSPRKARINWCALIGLGSLAGKFPPTKDLISYFQQSNYEKFGTRPILYVMHDKSPLSVAADALRALRAECAAAGVSNPYIVVQSGAAKTAAADTRTIGADAIGAYANAPPISSGPIPYAKLDAFVRQSWTEMAATGVPIVPNGMTGWDRRPRIDHPPPFDPVKARPDDYVVPGTPMEIAAHIGAALSFARSNAQACPSDNVLVYSWNECDEGGSVLCPTWSERGPDHAILDAVSKVLK
jgi:hypothetical protein